MKNRRDMRWFYTTIVAQEFQSRIHSPVDEISQKNFHKITQDFFFHPKWDIPHLKSK